MPRGSRWPASLAAILVVAILAGPRAWDSFQRGTEPAGSDPVERLASLSGTRRLLWGAALDSFADRPLRGIGAGTFEFAWNRYPHRSGHVLDAHSLYLESLAEIGIAGALLVVAALAALLTGALRSVRRQTDDTTRAVAAGCAVAFLVFCVTAGVDWMWESTAVTCLALVAGTLGAASPGLPLPRPRWPVRLRVAIPAAVAIVVQLPVLVAASEINASQRAAGQGRLVDALSSATAAAEAEPWSASAHLQRALVLEQIGELQAGGRFGGQGHAAGAGELAAVAGPRPHRGRARQRRPGAGGCPPCAGAQPSCPDLPAGRGPRSGGAAPLAVTAGRRSGTAQDDRPRGGVVHRVLEGDDHLAVALGRRRQVAVVDEAAAGADRGHDEAERQGVPAGPDEPDRVRRDGLARLGRQALGRDRDDTAPALGLDACRAAGSRRAGLAAGRQERRRRHPGPQLLRGASRRRRGAGSAPPVERKAANRARPIKSTAGTATASARTLPRARERRGGCTFSLRDGTFPAAAPRLGEAPGEADTGTPADANGASTQRVSAARATSSPAVDGRSAGSFASADGHELVERRRQSGDCARRRTAAAPTDGRPACLRAIRRGRAGRRSGSGPATRRASRRCCAGSAARRGSPRGPGRPPRPGAARAVASPASAVRRRPGRRRPRARRSRRRGWPAPSASRRPGRPHARRRAQQRSRRGSRSSARRTAGARRRAGRARVGPAARRVAIQGPSAERPASTTSASPGWRRRRRSATASEKAPKPAGRRARWTRTRSSTSSFRRGSRAS